MSLSTIYELCIKYNKCSEKLLVCEAFIVVKITMPLPPAEISREEWEISVNTQIPRKTRV